MYTTNYYEIKELYDDITKYLNNNWHCSDPSHDIYHCQRVCKRALLFANQYCKKHKEDKIDEKIIVTAAMFHDIVNLPKDSEERHLASTMSADKTIKIIESMRNFSSLRNCNHDKIYNAIQAHSYSACIKTNIKPIYMESKFIQDSDRIDALGALGIIRCFHIAGQMGSLPYDEVDPEARRRELDDKKYALDHFAVKLFQIPSKLQTTEAKKYCLSLISYMIKFRQKLVIAITKQYQKLELTIEEEFLLELVEKIVDAGKQNMVIYYEKNFCLIYHLRNRCKIEHKTYLERFLTQFEREINIIDWF